MGITAGVVEGNWGGQAPVWPQILIWAPAHLGLRRMRLERREGAWAGITQGHPNQGWSPQWMEDAGCTRLSLCLGLWLCLAAWSSWGSWGKMLSYPRGGRALPSPALGSAIRDGRCCCTPPPVSQPSGIFALLCLPGAVLEASSHWRQLSQERGWQVPAWGLLGLGDGLGGAAGSTSHSS